MDNRLWDESNLVHGDDSTQELIRKHAIYKAEMKKISSGAIRRGEDYGGGYDDSIANDLTEIEAALYERAIMKHDRDAHFYIMDNPVDGSFWIQQQLSIARAVLDELESFVPNEAAMALEPIIQKLKTIVPEPYPVSDDSDEDEDSE